MMDLHILLDPVNDFWKFPKKGFKKMIFGICFTKVGGLIGSTKTPYKNLKFDMVVNWHKYFFCRYIEFFLN